MRRILLLFVVTVLVSTACSSDDGGDDAAREVFPFDAVLIELFGTDDVGDYRYQIEREAEANLIECMADAGFDFVVDPSLPPEVSEDLVVERDYVDEHGFGIITRFRDWFAEADFDTGGRDLNREYLTTLTSDQMRAYFLALEGEIAEPGQISENPGCRGRAADEAYALWNTFLAELPNFTALGEERDTHPDWLVAQSEWRDCMLGKGFDYAEPEMMRTDVENRMSEDVSSVFSQAGLPLVEEDGEWVLDPEADALLTELQAFEIEAATANWECNQPLLDRFLAVEREVQQAFVDRNQDTIDALLAGQTSN